MVRYSNIHKIHPALAAAVQYVPPKVRTEDFRVTELTRPALMTYLEMIHDDKIVVDVGERGDLLDGVSVHEALARANISDALQEENLTMEIAGVTVGGRPDWYKDGIISDFKRTKVASMFRPTRTEYVGQLNFYAVLLRSYGFPVLGVEEVPIFKDWNKAIAETQRDYPRAFSVRRKVELWTPGKATEAMISRIKAHQEARAGNPTLCTPEERWAQPDNFAVMAPKKKRSLAVFGSDTARGGGIDEAEALVAAALPGLGLSVETRQGDSYVRCRKWCSVAPFCPQFANAAKR